MEATTEIPKKYRIQITMTAEERRLLEAFQAAERRRTLDDAAVHAAMLGIYYTLKHPRPKGLDLLKELGNLVPENGSAA